MGRAGRIVDDWGVPEGFFGSVPQDFAAAIGRVTMLAALLDEQLLALTWSLTDHVQTVHAGKSGTQLQDICRQAVKHASPELRREVFDFLDQVQQTRHLRNAVVHSVWPNPSLDAAFGWRSVRPGRNDGHFTTPFPTNRAAFARLVADLVDQIDQIDILQQRGHTEKAVRQQRFAEQSGSSGV